MKNTRKAALAAAENCYDTKVPCRRGHLSKRYTVSSSCAQCLTDRTRDERKKFRAALAKKKG